MSKPNTSTKDQTKIKKILEECLKDPSNKTCCECGAKQPRWASTNLGVFMCIRCSGIHRNLGVHISKVKSVSLDTWPMDQAEFMRDMGNEKANAVWEHSLPDGRKPTEDDTTYAVEAFIREKYEKKAFCKKEKVTKAAGKKGKEKEKEKEKAKKPVKKKPVSESEESESEESEESESDDEEERERERKKKAAALKKKKAAAAAAAAAAAERARAAAASSSSGNDEDDDDEEEEEKPVTKKKPVKATPVKTAKAAPAAAEPSFDAGFATSFDSLSVSQPTSAPSGDFNDFSAFESGNNFSNDFAAAPPKKIPSAAATKNIMDMFPTMPAMGGMGMGMGMMASPFAMQMPAQTPNMYMAQAQQPQQQQQQQQHMYAPQMAQNQQQQFGGYGAPGYPQQMQYGQQMNGYGMGMGGMGNMGGMGAMGGMGGMGMGGGYNMMQAPQSQAPVAQAPSRPDPFSDFGLGSGSNGPSRSQPSQQQSFF